LQSKNAVDPVVASPQSLDHTVVAVISNGFVLVTATDHA
jgi:hypothetical protein